MLAFHATRNPPFPFPARKLFSSHGKINGACTLMMCHYLFVVGNKHSGAAPDGAAHSHRGTGNMVKCIPPKLYHGCPTACVEKILTHGLNPTRSQSSLAAIFLTNDIFTARNYGAMKGDCEWTILEIDTSCLDIDMLGPDNYELQDALDLIEDEDDSLFGARWSEICGLLSLEICCQAAYYDVIPPCSIIVVS